MDRRERSGEANTSLLAALQGWQSGIQTAMPGVIQGFNSAKRTATVLPALQAQVQTPEGVKSWITLPQLLDCPVFFPSGGGVTLTFPVAVGDECLIIFGSRCIDNWWVNGTPSDANGTPTAQTQAEFRMHDLSDGFCLVGVNSVPKVIPAISSSTAQLRNNAGTTYVEVDPTGKVSITTTQVVNLTAPTINLTGAVRINGSLSLTGSGTVTGTLAATGDVTSGGISLHNHTHSDPQGGTVGPPQ